MMTRKGHSGVLLVATGVCVVVAALLSGARVAHAADAPAHSATYEGWCIDNETVIVGSWLQMDQRPETIGYITGGSFTLGPYSPEPNPVSRPNYEERLWYRVVATYSDRSGTHRVDGPWNYHDGRFMWASPVFVQQPNGAFRQISYSPGSVGSFLTGEISEPTSTIAHDYTVGGAWIPRGVVVTVYSEFHWGPVPEIGLGWLGPVYENNGTAYCQPS